MPYDGSGAYTRTNGNFSGSTLWQQKAAQPNPKIDAAEHDAEMNDVASALSSVITKNGTTSPTANLPMANFKHTGCANATNDNEYATLGQVNSIFPVAITVPYAGGAAPTGWLLADGSAVSRSTYSNLYAQIGTTYGSGDGSTTFNLPNLTGRFVLCKASSGTGSALGATGGSIDHTHTQPTHVHDFSHTHTMAHTHDSGSLTAKIGGANAQQGWGLMMQTGAEFEGNGARTILHAGHTSAVWANPWGTSATISDTIASSVTVQGTAMQGTTSAASNSTTSAASTSTTSASGNDVTGSNNPPFIALNYIIKY